jgi:hypothetical protein
VKKKKKGGDPAVQQEVSRHTHRLCKSRRAASHTQGNIQDQQNVTCKCDHKLQACANEYLLGMQQPPCNGLLVESLKAHLNTMEWLVGFKTSPFR